MSERRGIVYPAGPKARGGGTGSRLVASDLPETSCWPTDIEVTGVPVTYPEGMEDVARLVTAQPAPETTIAAGAVVTEVTTKLCPPKDALLTTGPSNVSIGTDEVVNLVASSLDITPTCWVTPSE